MNLIPKPNGPCRLTGGFCSDPAILSHETDPSLPAEGYRLTVTEGGIKTASADEAGRFYAAQTVEQLADSPEGLPCGEYLDAPRYPYRGFMLDVSRHFFPLEEVKKLIDQCAKLKLNVFHWHLSDDQGFRIESKKFPRLNEIGSWREENGETVGGFYTQDEIRELTAYAARRFVTVIPEIDLPGHTSAITAAYPELCCSGAPGKVESTAGIFPRILCGGEERVYEFAAELLDEVCPLFPAPWFHIGGDEAPKQEWEKCPKCQAAIGRYGLKNEEELQAHFTGRLEEILKKHGKTMIGWNEILASGTVSPSAVAQYWTDQGADSSAREIPKGRRFIFSNVNCFYLDYDHSIVTAQGAYQYEPVIPGGEAVPPQQALGLEAPLWTERVVTPEHLEEMVFPRLAALAENAWTNPEAKDWTDFSRRLRGYAKLWEQAGVSHWPIESALSPSAAEAADALIRQFRIWSSDKSEEEFYAQMKERLPGMGGGPIPLLSPSYAPEEQQAVIEELRKRLS